MVDNGVIQEDRPDASMPGTGNIHTKRLHRHSKWPNERHARRSVPPARNRSVRGFLMRIAVNDLRQRVLPILLAQAVGLACGLASVRLNSYLVAPSDYGLYGIFVSLTTVGAGVVFSGLLKYVGWRWPRAEERAGLLPAVLASARRKTIWLAAAVALITFIGGFDRPWLFGGALLAVALLVSVTQLSQQTLQAARQNWRDFSLSGAASVTRAFAPPLFYVASGAGFFALISGFTFHAAVTAALGAFLLRGHWRRRAASPVVLPATFDGPLFVILAIAGWVLAGFNRWVVAWLFGVETAGYFTLAANIATIAPSMLGTVMLQYLQPLWFSHVPANASERRILGRKVDQAALLYAGGGLLCAIAVAFITPRLVGSLLSVRYLSSLAFVLAAGCSTVAITTGFFYQILLLAVRRERACGPVDLLGAAALVTGSFISALAGREWFIRWLIFSPLVPWLVNRPLARRALRLIAAQTT
jgi:hypothetical protein